MKHVATVQKRRLLRQIGLRQADLDGLGLGYLDNWARAQAKVELLDADYSRRGFIDRRGKPRASVKVYFTALNSASRPLDKLGTYLLSVGLITGVLGTLLGHLFGLLIIGWVVDNTLPQTLPDLGVIISIAPGSVAIAAVVGMLAVAIAPLLTARRVHRMDVFSTLRVVE